MFAAYVPCMPAMPRKFSRAAGTQPMPMSVVTDGIPVRSRISRTFSAVFESVTPPPRIRSGRFASAIAAAAASTSAVSPVKSAV